MITRAMKDGNVVWFGSYGKNEDGTGKFYNRYTRSKKIGKDIVNEVITESYSKEQDAVRDSLFQRLSILKGELWYRITFGIPLFEKINSKTLIDTHVASVVTSNEDVIRIEKFESTLYNHKYTCNMVIISKFGNLNLQI